MKFEKIRPVVKLSLDDVRNPASKSHLHVVVGRKDGKLVSVQLTHSPKVPGRKTKKVPDNVEKSYAVSRAYVRDPSMYWDLRHPDSFEVSSRDRILLENVAKKTRRPLR